MPSKSMKMGNGDSRKKTKRNLYHLKHVPWNCTCHSANGWPTSQGIPFERDSWQIKTHNILSRGGSPPANHWLVIILPSENSHGVSRKATSVISVPKISKPCLCSNTIMNRSPCKWTLKKFTVLGVCLWDYAFSHVIFETKKHKTNQPSRDQ